MREIKFRAKAIQDGRWIYGLLRTRRGVDHGIIEDEQGLGIDIDLQTLGQYTGLKDKNGKDIYEGMLVRINREILFLKEKETDIDKGTGAFQLEQGTVTVVNGMYSIDGGVMLGGHNWNPSEVEIVDNE